MMLDIRVIFLDIFDFQEFNVIFWNYCLYMMIKFEFWKELAISLILSLEKSQDFLNNLKFHKIWM
jgi:hypothetical protein